MIEHSGALLRRLAAGRAATAGASRRLRRRHPPRRDEHRLLLFRVRAGRSGVRSKLSGPQISIRDPRRSRAPHPLHRQDEVGVALRRRPLGGHSLAHGRCARRPAVRSPSPCPVSRPGC